MSNDNALRELKFSPSQLVVVFLAILVLGIFVFLLGISVGKKQTQVQAQAQARPAGTEQPKVESLSPPIKTGAYATTTAPAETKAAPNAAVPAEKKAEEKAEPKTKPTESRPAEPKPTEPKSAPAESKTKATAAPAYTSAPFYVQIGAVENRPAAEAFAKRVTGLGFPTLVLDPFAGDKKPVFRVRVGPYPSKAEAANAQDELAAALKKKKTDFFLVKS